MSQGRKHGSRRLLRLSGDRQRNRIASTAIVLLVTVLALCLGWSVPRAQTDADEPLRLNDRILPERAEVDLVLIDVIVTDRKRNPIQGLTVEDFELRIDDSPAEISTFEAYCDDPVYPGRPPENARDQESSSSSSSSSDPRAVRPPRHVVLFFDIYQLSEEGRDRSVEAAREYIENRMLPDDRVMILAFKREPRLLENFTSDRERLVARLDAMLGDPWMIDRYYLEERLNINDIMGRMPNNRRNLAQAYAEEEFLRTRRSLEALRSLMPALGSLQGRKTLVHFSELLRDEPGLQYLGIAGTSPSAVGLDLQLTINRLHQEANAAGVSLYMVWAAGLGEKGSMGMADASLNTRVPGDTILLERALLSAEDSALSLGATLALETGGVATARTNDLSLAFEAVERDLSCYYVLGYTNRGPGDGKRHMIKVSTGGKRTRVRHRPYYYDWSETDRLDRRFQSALMSPAYFDEIEVRAEAYALAPEDRKTPLLLKVEFPMSAVTLVRQADGARYGEAEVRTRVWTDGGETCEFTRRIPVELKEAETAGDRRVIYEAGCELKPGDHELTVAVLDAGTWEMGAAGAPLPVPERSTGVTGDVVLWTSSGGDLLHAEDASDIGIHATGRQHGFVPRAQRRFSSRESGLLYVVVCPPEDGDEVSPEGIEVHRRLYSGEIEVASYGEIRLGRGGEGTALLKEGACQGIFAPIPAGRLGPGGYVFEVEVEGARSFPLIHQAGIAVSDPGDGVPDS